MKKQLWRFGILLIVAILLAPFSVDFVREVIVIPLLYLIWILRFLFDTISQDSLWLFILVLIALVMLFSLIDKGRFRPLRPPPLSPQPGRVESWETLLRQSQQDDYFRWRLAQQLQRLTLAIMAHQSGETLHQTRLALRHGQLKMPPRVLAYFQASLQPLGYLPQPRTLFSAPPPPSPLHLDPNQVVQFLEELHHGPPDSEEKV
jgi:hypothetical protein